jgi:hypothetical protein
MARARGAGVTLGLPLIISVFILDMNVREDFNRSVPAGRGRRDGGPDHGNEKGACADAYGCGKRKTAGFGVPSSIPKWRATLRQGTMQPRRVLVSARLFAFWDLPTCLRYRIAVVILPQ